MSCMQECQKSITLSVHQYIHNNIIVLGQILGIYKGFLFLVAYITIFMLVFFHKPEYLSHPLKIVKIMAIFNNFCSNM